MAQGQRGGWLRVAFAGLGFAMCIGTIGCMNTDKDKMPPKIGSSALNKQHPGVGLPGTPTLPGSSGIANANAKSVQPVSGMNPYAGYGKGGVQQAGSFATGTNAPMGGSNVVPSVSPADFNGSGKNYGSIPSPNMNTSMQPPMNYNTTGNTNYSTTGGPPAPTLDQLPVPPAPHGSRSMGTDYQITPPTPLAPGPRP